MSSSSLFAQSLVLLAITLPGCVGSSWLLPQDPASLAELSGARNSDRTTNRESASTDGQSAARETASIDSILDEVEYLKEAEPAKYRLLKTALQEAAQEELPPHVAAQLQHQMRAVMSQHQPTEIGLEPSPFGAEFNSQGASELVLHEANRLEQAGNPTTLHQLVTHQTPSGVRASAFEAGPQAGVTANPLAGTSPMTNPTAASPSADPGATESPTAAATPTATRTNSTEASSAGTSATPQPEPSTQGSPQPEAVAAATSQPAPHKKSEPPPTPSSELEQELEVAEANWRNQLASSIARLEEEVATTQDPAVRAELETHLRVAYILANRREDALRAIGELSEHEAEYWKHLAHGLLVSLDPDQRHAESRKAALSLRHLRNAVDHLANTSTLDLRNLSFCRQVISFGDYEEFKPYTFQPGSEVALYVEVENFAVQTVEGKFETELHGEYSILDARGAHVFSSVLPRDKQICNNRRRDYFIAYRLFLPEEIAVGDYQLMLTMEDVKGKKSNQASVEFKIQ